MQFPGFVKHSKMHIFVVNSRSSFLPAIFHVAKLCYFCGLVLLIFYMGMPLFNIYNEYGQLRVTINYDHVACDELMSYCLIFSAKFSTLQYCGWEFLHK